MRIYPFRVEKPAALEVITLEQARQWLNMDIEGVTFADNLIQDLVAAAVDYVETKINTSLGISTYEWYPECFPKEVPDTFFIRSLTAIERTEDGEYVTVEPANYSLIRSGKRRTSIKWVENYTNEYQYGYSPYKVTFTAGYAPEEIPETIKMAVRALIAAWYDRRDDYVAEKKTLADKLLAPFIIGYA